MNPQKKDSTLLVIDEDFLSELTALSPDYNKIKNLFEKVVHDKTQRQYIIYLALLNRRTNSIMSALDRIEEQEQKLIRRDSPDLPAKLKELNNNFTQALQEFNLLGKDLTSMDYYKDVLQYYIQDESKKYLSAKIYNKYEVSTPERMTAFSDGYDIALPTDISLYPNKTTIVDTGLIIEPPPGYHVEIQIRSSLSKLGIVMPTGVSIIDSDYCGKEDFIQLIFTYVGDKELVSLGKGQRVAQLRFIKNTPQVEFLQTPIAEFKNPTRGGLGSTTN